MSQKVSSFGGHIVTEHVSKKGDGITLHHKQSNNIIAIKDDKSNKFTMAKTTGKSESVSKDGAIISQTFDIKEPSVKKNMTLDDVIKSLQRLYQYNKSSDQKKSKSVSKSRGRSSTRKSKSKSRS